MLRSLRTKFAPISSRSDRVQDGAGGGRPHHRGMSASETMHLLVLDQDWRPLRRLDGSGDWRDITAELLRIEGQWLVIEQQRADDPAPLPQWDDIRLSRAISRRLRPMEVKLADHVIQGGAQRFSFREAGLL